MTARRSDHDQFRLAVSVAVSLSLHLVIALSSMGGAEILRLTAPIPPSLQVVIAGRPAPTEVTQSSANQSIAKSTSPPNESVSTDRAAENMANPADEGANLIEPARMMSFPSRLSLEQLESWEQTRVTIALEISHIGSVTGLDIAADRPLPQATLDQLRVIFSNVKFFPAKKSGEPVASGVRLTIEISPLPDIKIGVPGPIPSPTESTK